MNDEILDLEEAVEAEIPVGHLFGFETAFNGPFGRSAHSASNSHSSSGAGASARNASSRRRRGLLRNRDQNKPPHRRSFPTSDHLATVRRLQQVSPDASSLPIGSSHRPSRRSAGAPINARSGRTPPVQNAIVERPLPAQLRRPTPWSATSAIRRSPTFIRSRRVSALGPLERESKPETVPPVHVH